MLSNAFGELFSSDVLEDTTIINLETSRTHDDDFHDYYVQLLTEVSLQGCKVLTSYKMEVARLNLPSPSSLYRYLSNVCSTNYFIIIAFLSLHSLDSNGAQ